jgi:Na+/H+ antiporter NhaC
LLFFAFLVVLLAKKYRIPIVVGYVFLGIILSPDIISIIPAIDQEMSRMYTFILSNLDYVTNIALAFIAFTIGSSWGTVAIVMPLAIPLAYNIASPMLPAIGAVLTAAVMGDHCSPISDTTIMSSTASAVDHMDHVTTQLPYALTVGAVAALFGFLPAGFGVSPIITLPIGVIVLYLIVQVFGKSVKEEKLEDVSMDH